MLTYPEQTIMIASTQVERTVRNVKPHVPNRYSEQDYDDYPDETGIISLEGKKVGVQTAFRGDVLVWELIGSGPTHPHCEVCSSPLYIGTEIEWRCGLCDEEKRKQRATEKALQEV